MTDTSSSSGDCSISSPHRRTRTVSPHHNRSLSFRNMKRPTPQQNPVKISDIILRKKKENSIIHKNYNRTSTAWREYRRNQNVAEKTTFNSRNWCLPIHHDSRSPKHLARFRS
ncbi:hypothetical protein CDAR_560901 [Caerostris darwini]|uniref:Uncharacterized protein n=1 Tax=Caerostris darwini TaxID=1538125 RepID=A0AAV4R792_9ARAC|nr:hypothetical protein CDAR_560901 [Caerostris darwini]